MQTRRKLWTPRVGQKFSRLTFVVLAGHDKHRARLGKFNCACGTRGFITRLKSVHHGLTKSCHCLQREIAVKQGRINGRKQKGKTHAATSGSFKSGHTIRKIHGHATPPGSPTYRSYRNMLSRVQNPKDEHYRWYKNVQITPRWLGPNGFVNFLADMHERPTGTTLGRILDSPTPGYCKSNCHWMSRAEQMSERRARTAMRRFAEVYGHQTVKVKPRMIRTAA